MEEGKKGKVGVTEESHRKKKRNKKVRKERVSFYKTSYTY